jgi:hypothetical protein
MVTFVNSMDVYDRYAVPSEFKEAIEILKSLPEGNVLCDPIIGNFVPALTQHKVYVGHWFLTPEYTQKSKRYTEAMQGKGVRELVRSENIRYIIGPLVSLPVLSRDLQVETITSWQDIALLEVHRQGR